ncbi:MAG: single-stranded DNA-binding protein [Oscillospiraceae bacterium]|nr:single-stranded DNA-binding protein [Oscillospiraceae bacterium]
MTGNIDINLVRLCGTLAAKPVFSHESRGQAFYRLPLEVRRLSGAADTLPVLLRRELLEALGAEGEKLCVTGELRTFNNHRGEGARLVITVFARELSFCGGEDEDAVQLSGTLCKPPVLRRTPLGREICDLLLAVNRRYGRSDYLPCICWGRTAREAAALGVGARVRLEGRFQSRGYIKLVDGAPVEKTAYEVSASTVEAE